MAILRIIVNDERPIEKVVFLHAIEKAPIFCEAGAFSDGSGGQGTKTMELVALCPLFLSIFLFLSTLLTNSFAFAGIL